MDRSLPQGMMGKKTMKPSDIQYYCAPQSHVPLHMDGNHLVATDGRRFAIENGVPNLLWPPELSEVEAKTKSEYDRVAEQIYDAALNWQFAALYEDEETVRELMINMLDPKPDARILEVGCGTGRDSFRLARRLDALRGSVPPGLVSRHGAHLRQANGRI